MDASGTKGRDHGPTAGGRAVTDGVALGVSDADGDTESDALAESDCAATSTAAAAAASSAHARRGSGSIFNELARRAAQRGSAAASLGAVDALPPRTAGSDARAKGCGAARGAASIAVAARA